MNHKLYQGVKIDSADQHASFLGSRSAEIPEVQAAAPEAGTSENGKKIKAKSTDIGSVGGSSCGGRNQASGPVTGRSSADELANCKSCTFINTPGSRYCKLCKGEIPEVQAESPEVLASVLVTGRSSADELATCKSCTFINTPGSRYCKLYKGEIPEVQAASPEVLASVLSSFGVSEFSLKKILDEEFDLQSLILCSKSDLTEIGVAEVDIGKLAGYFLGHVAGK